MVKESVVTKHKLPVRVQKFTGKVPLEKPISMPSIVNLLRLRTVVFREKHESGC